MKILIEDDDREAIARIAYAIADAIRGEGVDLPTPATVERKRGPGRPRKVQVELIDPMTDKIDFVMQHSDDEADPWPGQESVVEEPTPPTAEKTRDELFEEFRALAHAQDPSPALWLRTNVQERFGVEKVSELTLEQLREILANPKKAAA